MFKRKIKKPLTRSECLERLRECFKKADFRHALTDDEREQMDFNLQIITAFVRLNDTEEIREVHAIGFDTSGAEEEDEEEDEDGDE